MLPVARAVSARPELAITIIYDAVNASDRVKAAISAVNMQTVVLITLPLTVFVSLFLRGQKRQKTGAER